MRSVFSRIWKSLAIAGFALLALNLWCWDYGYGLRPERIDFELYIGWPAIYRADWWWSTDRTFGPAFLAGALWAGSSGELVLKSRYVGLLPALADVAFGIAVLVVVGTVAHFKSTDRWSRVHTTALLIAGGVLFSIWQVAPQIGVHL